MKLKTELFGVLPDGRKAYLYTLTNNHGRSVTLTDLGAGIRDIVVSGRDGKLVDVSLCHGSFEDSIANKGYLGATCGRIANRIRGAEFLLNGKTHKLRANDPNFILHGGPDGFSSALWKAEPSDSGTVTFYHHSPDGDQGFPGALDVTARYTWDDDDRLAVEYGAKSEADTIVNLTNHVYFNLSGQADGSIEDHTLVLDCDYYLPIDELVCVTGEIRKVDGTAMDFTTPRTIGERLRDDQLKNGNGYDISYVLRTGEGVRHCAKASSPKTGIVLDTFTDYPAVHLYTGNMLEPYAGKDGAVYRQYGAFCLETQLFPDFMNCPGFGKHVLSPGGTYSYRTEYVFSC